MVLEQSAALCQETLTPAMGRAKWLSVFALAIMMLSAIGLDQVTKLEAEQKLMVWTDGRDLALYSGRRYPLVEIGQPPNGVTTGQFFVSFNFNYVRNQGAAWGALSNLPSGIRVPFFYGVTMLAVAVILLYMRATPVSHRLARFALSLILAGAVGNFIDRIRLGYVIDWIDVHWSILGWRYYFPNFNVADSAITVGITLLMIDMFIVESRRRHKSGVQHGPTST